MKIRLYSDLHVDWYFANGVPFNLTTGKMDCWYPPELPDDKETILIIAGDVWIGTRWIEFAGYSWIADVAPRFKDVLVVLGNHDYWPTTRNGLCIMNGADKCRSMLQDHHLYNVHVLDRTTFEVDDFVFIGATLWTDMNKGNPLVMYRMPQYMVYDGKISYMNDPYTKFTSQRWVDTHLVHKNYIDCIAKNYPDKKIVVITHHQPLEQMVDPMYKGNEANAYYYSDLSDLILSNENIIAWICGHSHIQYDEMFGNCRLLMNAVGYAGESKEQKGLVKHETLVI